MFITPKDFLLEFKLDINNFVHIFIPMKTIKPII